MMPIIRSENNDQNIKRFLTKMSEEYAGQTNANLLSAVNFARFYNNSLISNDPDKEELNLPYDHMYATNTENEDGEVTTTNPKCQTTESEVRFLKEWLILHLDLIQQQNDEILNKEKTILILQRENEMLKERVKCMEQGTPFLVNNHFTNHTTPEYLETNSVEDMTQDTGLCEEDNKDNIDLLSLNCLNGNTCSVELIKIEPNNVLGDHLQIKTGEKYDEKVNNTQENSQSEINSVNNSDIVSETAVECNKSIDFNPSSINDTSDFDPMRNLKTNVTKRKRVCSNSSAVSNNDSATEEKRHFRRFRKKKKRVLKDTQVMTTSEPYITHAGESLVGTLCDNDPPIIPNKTLEVPRWRVKVYASCYTMEGTENLDDEVYYKRHNRLEIDERRRKRWDVQRIREQRVIDKLKQRQERTASGNRGDDHGDKVQTLWPKLEDIKFIEVCNELPVSAFGFPMPKTTPSEFSLPWMNTPRMSTKKVPAKRSTAKRKLTKR